jgi:anti-sigma regulatory factor (Ser/Thr protein kinase)
MFTSEQLDYTKALMTKASRFVAAAGGKWFLSPIPLLLSVPFTVTTSILTTGLSEKPSSFDLPSQLAHYSKLLIANVISLGACAIVILLLSKALKRRSLNPIPIWLVISIGAFLGSLKGFTMGLTSWTLGAEFDLTSAIESRLIQTTLLGMWLIPAVAVIASVLEGYQKERDALVAERVQWAMSNPDSNFDEDNLRTLRRFIDEAKNQLENSRLSMPAAIRSLVSDELRPLSHKIWDAESERLGKKSIQESLIAALHTFPFPATGVAVSYLLGSVPVLLKFVSLSESVLRSVAATFAIFLIFQIAKLAYKLVRKFLFFQIFLFTGIAACAAYFVGDQIFTPIPAYLPGVTIAALWVWILQLTVVCSSVLGIRKSQEEIRGELFRLQSSKPFERTISLAKSRLENRNFANFLHGQVQNKLLSVALRLENENNSELSYLEAHGSIEEVLSNAEKDFLESRSQDFDTRLHSLVRQWSGFVEIDFRVSEIISTTELQKKTLLLQVVDEAISNSIRHGLAKYVRVTLNLNQEKISLEVVDDGIGPRSGSPGLGSNLFNTIAPGSWTLEHLPEGGSRLVMIF